MIICHCNEVTQMEIKKFLQKHPDATFDELKKETTAGTSCGRCTNVLQKTYERLKGELPQSDQIRITF
ncbi:MAG: (2Fe-2S)-binding protein [Prolixibacteraceae bacterium]